MAIVHKFIDDLNNIEENQSFCGEAIDKESRILFVGTFNPDNQSCLKENNATWFYGRNQSKFWRYMPKALTGNSIHALDGNFNLPQHWKEYCVTNKLVIIDLVKSIEIDDVLENFGDRQVDCKINDSLTNVSPFEPQRAFQKIRFEKVIYSLTWADNRVRRLRKLRDKLNTNLLEMGVINNENQIRYCLTPSRNDQRTIDSWANAINN